MNEKFKIWKEKASMFFSTVSKIAVILISMSVGFGINEFYRIYREKDQKILVVEKIPQTRTQKETSVAINERGEIIIMDRKDGSYQIYSDSVGLMVFNHYASKMYFKANSQK
jgi:hypothetical protein